MEHKTTFFTHLRPMEGEFSEIQDTAMQSWGSIGSVLDLTGKVELNTLGTPLVSSIFSLAEASPTPWLCWISGDIVLGADFSMIFRHIEELEKPFVVGQRWDVDRGDPESAVLHPPSALDYFLYRRGTLGEIPPFALGRTVHDNWMMWAANNLWGMQTIDATEIITAVHINHSHPEYGTKEQMIQSEERAENVRLAHETGCYEWQGAHQAMWFISPLLELEKR